MEVIDDAVCQKCGSETFQLLILKGERFKMVCSECGTFGGFLVPNRKSGKKMDWIKITGAGKRPGE